MDFKLSSKSTLYLEIANEYKKYISLGIIKEGEKLPSVRSLATDLGINPNTVARAYQVLEEDGYITTYPKKGAYATFKQDNEKEKIKTYKHQILMIKNSGMKKNALIDLIEQVYRSEDND